MAEKFTEAQVKELFPKRDELSNKGDYGYIALVGGCVKYSGAIRLADMASAAMRSGAGVCAVAVPRSVCQQIIPQILESTLFPLDDSEGELVFNSSQFDELINKYDVIAFGMGIGNTEETRKALKYLLDHYTGILVVDADGINAMTKLGKKTLRSRRCKLVLTPHPKEFSRLAKRAVSDVVAKPEESCKALAAFLNCIVLLKGHSTVVSDGEDSYVVERGCAGMATAGSGDVLAGLLAALLASHKDELLKAAAAAAYINGLAGELASKEVGETCQIASDTAKHIGPALQQILGCAEKSSAAADPVSASTLGSNARRVFNYVFAVLLIAALSFSVWYGYRQHSTVEELLAREFDPEAYVLTMEFLSKDIYVDGVLINNYQISRPLTRFDDRIYVPLSPELCCAFGISAEWDGAHPRDLYITKTEANHAGAFVSLDGWDLSPVSGWARGSVIVHIKNGEDEELIYPDAKDIVSYSNGETIYIPIRYLAQSSLLDISIKYDDYGGIFVSTDEAIDAEAYVSENNIAYIKGRAEYIRQFRPEMSLGECAAYEYIFRHEANTREIDEDLLLAIARTESSFNKNDISSAGALGIMQVLASTALAHGIEPAELFDVHASVRFGSGYIRDAIKNFNGDKVKALSAYNFGGGAVLGGNYDEGYANTVLSRVDGMRSWIAGGGYSNEFLTVVECTK